MARILAIEDDESFCRAITKYVSKCGFEVFTARSGPEGIVKALADPPDLIVCDLVMPTMDGFEVLRLLRENDSLASVPVIFLTGRSEPHQVRQGMNLGADDYLTKPLNMEDLVNAIKARLARRQSEKEKHEKQLDRAMQIFSGIIHDLRDPLFVALGYANRLKTDARSSRSNNHSSGQTVDRICQTIERMQSIVAQTMDLVRTQMQRVPLDASQFDLRDFCSRMLSEHPLSRRLRFEAAPGDYPILAD